MKKTTSEKALKKRTENDAKTPSKGINEWVKNVSKTTPEKTSKKQAEHDHLGIHFGLLFVGNLDTNLVNLDDNLVNLERVSRLTKLLPKLTKFVSKLSKFVSKLTKFPPNWLSYRQIGPKAVRQYFSVDKPRG